MILFLVHLCIFLTLAQFYRITCVERHSICKCLRRLPSLWLALSIEFAFAAHCMYARITAMSNATKCVACLQRTLGRSCRQLGSRFCPLRWMNHGLAVLETGQPKVLQLRFHEQEGTQQSLPGPMHRGSLAWTAVPLAQCGYRRSDVHKKPE